MRKALNFDLDTKKYEEFTGKHPPIAYAQIRNFLKKNDFEHRQGSGYISRDSLNDGKIFAIIQNMSMELKWLRHCVEQIDVTNIGKQHSMVDAVNKATTDNEIADLSDIEI